jgi:hypothetical protein
LQELEAAGAKSANVGSDEMSDRVRWIRSYSVNEPDGRSGASASIRPAIRNRSALGASGMPGDQIFPVVTTIVIRDDPKAATEAA